MRPLLFKLSLFHSLAGALLLVLSLPAAAALADISRIYHQQQTVNGFDFCSGGGCAEVQHVALDAGEWQQVADEFYYDNDAAEDAAALEREHIANAIGVLEKIVGDKTGTSNDRAGTFDQLGISGQLDCNDEAINSTTYMRLMVQGGLIKLHVVEDMRTRNFFFTGWPHSTAVVHELKSGKRYAVDSWFFDNGEPATIVPFDTWKAGYIPEDSPLQHMRSAYHSYD